MSDQHLARKLTRDEFKLLTDQEKKDRRLAQSRITKQKYPEKNKERSQKYYQDHKEYYQKYYKTPAGKKTKTMSSWVNHLGLQETKENLDRIYIMWLNQKLCNACDCVMTRGSICSTQAQMDHCHDTHRFRHIICHACNTRDSWKKHFC